MNVLLSPGSGGKNAIENASKTNRKTVEKSRPTPVCVEVETAFLSGGHVGREVSSPIHSTWRQHARNALLLENVADVQSRVRKNVTDAFFSNCHTLAQ